MKKHHICAEFDTQVLCCEQCCEESNCSEACVLMPDFRCRDLKFTLIDPGVGPCKYFKSMKE